MKLFFVILLTLFIHISSCKCPERNPSLNLTFDLNLQPHKDYGLEWWYYLFDLEDDNSNRHQFISCFGRISIDQKCNSTIELHKELFKYDDFNEEFIQIKETPFTDYLDFTINSTIKRINDKTTIITNTNKHVNLTIYDGTGLQLQGAKHDGYVPGGFSKDCNAAYSASFLGLDVNGIINGISMEGIGYGEHVFMSLNSANIKTLFIPFESKYGWYCHYLHYKYIGGYTNIQLCESFSNEITGKHGMIQNNKETKWLTYDDFNCSATFYWHSDRTDVSYPVSWSINITDGFLRTYPDNFNQELNKGTEWIGSVFSMGIMNGMLVSGVGFTEIVII
jgi:predicted secreted hydrolase